VKGYLVFKAHKNKIPTAIPMLSGLTFSMAIIFTSLRVVVIPEINMADKKAKVVSVWHVFLISQRCKTVIVCFRGCGRHGSSTSTVRIYSKSIFQDGDCKPELLSICHRI